MERIIFATANSGKLAEIKEIFKNTPYEVVSMKEAGIEVDITEDGTTFFENAYKKAQAVWSITGGNVMSDDSGLEVDYLGGYPGVFSARFLGEDTSYDIKNNHIIEKLAQAEGEERKARFRACICMILGDGSVLKTEATMEGRIAHHIEGDGGFGYDPILYLPEYGMTSAQLSMEEKNKISHRGKALRQMCEMLVEYDKRN